MHSFFTWSGTGSVPLASPYRLTSSRNLFRRSSTPSILEPNLCVTICTNSPVLPSCRTFRTSGTVVCKLRNRCFQLSSRLSVLPFVWASWVGTARLQTAVRVVESPSQGRIGRIERTRVSVESKVPVVKVFARCVRLWLPDSHLFWARFRHRLTHCSLGFRESCHRCVHRSARRLLTNFNHLCSELIELTSQHLNFLSRCHHHSISQYRNTRITFQDNQLRYHVRMGNHAKRVNVRCALWMMRALFSLSESGPSCVWEACQCQVYCNRLWCDQLCNNITRVQQAFLVFEFFLLNSKLKTKNSARSVGKLTFQNFLNFWKKTKKVQANYEKDTRPHTTPTPTTTHTHTYTQTHTHTPAPTHAATPMFFILFLSFFQKFQKEKIKKVLKVSFPKLRAEFFVCSFIVCSFLVFLVKNEKLLRYTHIPTPLDDSTRPLDNSTNSTLHNPQRAGALVTSIILDGGPHGWVPVNTHSAPVLPKWEEAVGCSQTHTNMRPITKGMEGPFTTW